MDSNEAGTCETIQINKDFIKIANQLKIQFLNKKKEIFEEIINEILVEIKNNENT